MTGAAVIPGGYILLSRKLLNSGIMEKPPLYLKLWVWMLMQASHQNHGKLKRGQFFTSLDRMREAMKYKVGASLRRPTRKQIRKAVDFLSKGHAIGTAKVTHGLLITILNYDLYQTPQNYEGHIDNQKSLTPATPKPATEADLQGYEIAKAAKISEGPSKGTTKGTEKEDITSDNNSIYYDEEHSEGHSEGPREGTILTRRDNKKGKTPEEISNEISLLIKKYDQDLINKCFAVIRSTRKSGKVADSVLIAQLKKWERYPVEQVEAGVRIYLEKDYAAQGKDETYLLGIIRNQKADDQTGPVVSEYKISKEITLENIDELYKN